MMRVICLLLVSIFALKVNAQQYTKFNGYGFAADRMRSDSISIHPSDTIRNKTARSIAVLNGVFYIADGTKWKVVGTDTTSLSNRINLKLNIADTSAMLNPYLRKTDTVTLSNRINTKLNISDTASMLSPYSKLKSVGLTMPSAFSVANSPLTSDGTLAVSGAGTAAQYVRGDGQLANFPSNEGGGSSVNYYLNGSVNQGTFGGDTYYELSKIPIIGAGTNFTRTNAQGNGYIASFITDAGDPALLNIPGGNWNIEFYFNASSGGSTPSFYAEIYKVSSSNVFTLIASGSTNPEGITQGTVVDQYFTSIPVPQTTILATDRIAIRIFVTTSGRTITLHTENSNLSEVLTTFSTGLNALNGLTSQVQYFATGTSGTDFNISSATDTHTFNIPSASTSARGLITTDAQTFAGAKTFNGGINLPNFIPINFTNGATVEGFNGKLVFRTVSGTAGYFENNSLYLAAMDNEPSTSNIGVMVKNFNSESKVGYKTPAQMMTYLGALGTTDTATMLNPYTRGSGTSGQVAYWNATRSLTGSSGFTFTPTSSLLVNNSVTAASTIARGTNLTPTLVASANNDVLVGLDINPTFTNGAFSGVQNSISRINLGVAKTFTSASPNAFAIRTNDVSQEQVLYLSYLGNANAANRSFIFQTTENNVAFNGNIVLQNQGGRVLIGANTFSTGTTFEVTGTSRFNGNIALGSTSIWDNTNGRLGINTTTPGSRLVVVQSSGTIASFTNGVDADLQVSTVSGISTMSTSVGALALGATSTEAMRIFASTRNVLIQNGGTFTDAGFRLDVNGTARFNVGGGETKLQTNTQNFVSHNRTSSSGVLGFDIRTSGNQNSFWTYDNGTGDVNFGQTAIGAGALKLFTANTERMRIFYNGNIGMNTTTDAGFRLDVNGTARVQDALTVSKNQNASTILTVSNTTAGTGSQANLTLQSDATAGNGQLFKYSSSRPAYKTINSSDLGFYNATGGNISILNDNASGNINFTAGASSNAQLTIASSGNITQSVNQNASTTLKVSNTTSGTASESILLLTSNNGNFQFGKTSSTKTAFKTISANDGYIFNDVSGNISILNNFASGNINFAAGGSSNSQATLASTGNLLIGTTTDIASSKLTVESTTQGFLPPRMTTAQRDLIGTPAAGLIIYNTSTSTHQGYNGTTWNNFY